jgi:hypothetical protein
MFCAFPKSAQSRPSKAMADKRNRWRLRNPGLAPATNGNKVLHPKTAVKNIPARFAESTRHGFPRDIRRKKAEEKIIFQPGGLKYCSHASQKHSKRTP